MAHDERIHKEHQILVCLASLPRRILSLHDSGFLSGFVLHELCNKNCFDWKKAAYFVDNPDFDCLKGVAGFDNGEQSCIKESIWDNPESYKTYMKSSPFNLKVRGWCCESCERSKTADEDIINAIAQKLGFGTYGFYSWDVRNHNRGIIIYEKSVKDEEIDDNCVQNGVCLLGLCPII